MLKFTWNAEIWQETHGLHTGNKVSYQLQSVVQISHSDYVLIKLRHGPYHWTRWIPECSSCTILLGLRWSRRAVQSCWVWRFCFRLPGRIDFCLQGIHAHTSEVSSKLKEDLNFPRIFIPRMMPTVFQHINRFMKI